MTALTLTAAPPPDGWLEDVGSYPHWVTSAMLETNRFSTLQADVVAGRLKLRWETTRADTHDTVVAHASADALGHWPARDWRPYPMTWSGLAWETILPVDHIDIPMVYFVQVQAPEGKGKRVVSPLRAAWPRPLGMEEPSRVFWAFLEGFEEDLESWRLLSDIPGGMARTNAPWVKNGKQALVASIPAGKRSVAVGTTRLRGWQVAQQQLSGVSLWMRTVAGPGTARFTLFSHAFTTNQVMAPCSRDAVLTEEWQQVRLPFSAFRGPLLGQLDFLAIECVAHGPRQFLIDDLECTESWVW